MSLVDQIYSAEFYDIDNVDEVDDDRDDDDDDDFAKFYVKFIITFFFY